MRCATPSHALCHTEPFAGLPPATLTTDCARATILPYAMCAPASTHARTHPHMYTRAPRTLTHHIVVSVLSGDAEANTDDLCSPRRRFEEAKLQDQEAAEVLDGRSGTPLPLVG
jgi:hypothetical protein